VRNSNTRPPALMSLPIGIPAAVSNAYTAASQPSSSNLAPWASVSKYAINIASGHIRELYTKICGCKLIPMFIKICECGGTM
jgi:hypothetical protein